MQALRIPETSSKKSVRVVVATSVMLSFISFWRAAAIVLNDLGSSAFYAGGIAEQAIGESAPWFILAVMLFSYAVRAIYVESCAMFTRGGVYRVVKAAMGGTLAKVSVSALIFDYILTGPISGVSAGQYIVGLIAHSVGFFGIVWNPTKDTINHIAAGIAVLITIYFWWRNTKGMHESSEDALRIMKVTTLMVVIMIIWSAITILSNHSTRRLPPIPKPTQLEFNKDAVGWMPTFTPDKFITVPKEQDIQSTVTESPQESHIRYKITPNIGILFSLFGLLIGFGHSFLAMSGEESLAQVNRELEHPKHRNLMRAGTVIFVYSLLFTSLVSFFAYSIIPDEIRPQFYDNLISGIAMYLAGPTPLKLIFQGFIVLVGFLMLAGAVNTAIIGSNGVLNRVSEDGVLADWFRHPHKRYGTSYRIINLVVVLQLVTIVASRGDVYLLGEAYAFGVIWSYSLKGIALLVLRFKDKSERVWKVPINLKLKKFEIPIGLGLVTAILTSVALVNLITKQVATISGMIFTASFFLLFFLSERYNEMRRKGKDHIGLDQFQLQTDSTISTEGLNVRPGNYLCLVRDYNTLEHLKKTLEFTNTDHTDLVVMTIRILKGPDSGYEELSQKDLFTNYEQLLFSKVVALAESAGKKLHLLVVPSSNIFQAMVLTAQQLHSSAIIAGKSAIMTPEIQSRRLGEAWERLPERPVNALRFRVVHPDGHIDEFYLGAHTPKLTDDDIALIHQIWLDLSQQQGNENLHHRDVVNLALKHFELGIKSPQRNEILKKIVNH